MDGLELHIALPGKGGDHRNGGYKDEKATEIRYEVDKRSFDCDERRKTGKPDFEKYPQRYSHEDEYPFPPSDFVSEEYERHTHTGNQIVLKEKHLPEYDGQETDAHIREGEKCDPRADISPSVVQIIGNHHDQPYECRDDRQPVGFAYEKVHGDHTKNQKQSNEGHDINEPDFFGQPRVRVRSLSRFNYAFQFFRYGRFQIPIFLCIAHFRFPDRQYKIPTNVRRHNNDSCYF